MEKQNLQIFFLVLLAQSVFSGIIDGNSLVVSSAESTREEFLNDEAISQGNPHITSMDIHTTVNNRFATTKVTRKIQNVENKTKETTFAVIIPEDALISEFEMEIKGKVYKAMIKGKEEAKKTYEGAVASGQTAAHVELRNSKTFTVSASIEPSSEATFRLTYEELLQRLNGQYELVLNINPGQTVEDLAVQVHINENRPLTFVRTPSLRTGKATYKHDERCSSPSQIVITNKISASVSAMVKFNPDVNDQKELAKYLGGQKEDGIAGQFVVQYDVARDPEGGEILVKDGYFVHFLAPSELQHLPKHVVFVLDNTGSLMYDKQFAPLAEAMQNILSELAPEDRFHLLRYAHDAWIWKAPEDKFVAIQINSTDYGNWEPLLRKLDLPPALEATRENINKARNVVQTESGAGLGNQMAGLEVALFLTKRTQEKYPNKYQPIIAFVTHGYALAGLTTEKDIAIAVKKLNSGPNPAAIFSVSLSDDIDVDFLRKLSSENRGSYGHVYGGYDFALQLQKLYGTISLPLLSDVTFNYHQSISQVTTPCPILFKGSELVVAGKTGDDPFLFTSVVGKSASGRKSFNATNHEAVASLERLWAFLTLKQMLEEKEIAANATEIDKKALDLALKYSFVTPVSSLVSGTDSVHIKVHDPRDESDTTQPAELVRIPQWLEDLKQNNKNITIAQGTFKLGQMGDFLRHVDCPKTPLKTPGACTILFDCPQIYSLLTDMNVYLEYFCPLGEYAGVCCPVKYLTPFLH